MPCLPMRILYEKNFQMRNGKLDFVTRVQPTDLHQAIIHTANHYGWKNVIYIYSTHEGTLVGS